jgi:hypothetical protein
MKKAELKVEALRCAMNIHCAAMSAVASASDHPKPSEVLGTAKQIYTWLKG